jgi:hypothetical protein
LVETWSTWALPFMNRTPAQEQYRKTLREALMSLRPDGVLHATHSSLHVHRGSDVENLLFYNVGASAFRTLAKDALRFERRNAPPPTPPARLDFEARHHIRYEVKRAEHSLFHHTNADALVASTGADCMASRQLRDLAGLWRLFKTGMVISAGSTLLQGNSFSVQFTISAPERHRFNLTDVVKPLTDAFISALHCYEGVHLEEVACRVSTFLNCPPQIARELLLDSHSALLGPRAVPHLRAKGLQWSPADDGLIACEIIRDTSPADGSIEVRGRLFSAPTL